MLFLSYVFWLNGHVDPHYLHFASPKQKSLVLGTSRSSLAVCPSIFEANGFKGVYNYSFTIAISPWGEDYYNSIMKKVDTTSFNSIFILSVDPFSIATELNGNEEIPHTMLASIDNVDKSPNWQYLTKHDVYPWKYLFTALHIQKPTFCLHNDGWYENLREWNKETEFLETKLKIEEYKRNFSNHKLSQERMSYLSKTIEFLRKHGDVFLIRIPTSKAMVALEEELFPMYDSVIQTFAKKQDIRYMDFSGESEHYRTFDGNHLIPEDALVFSQQLCDSLLNKDR